MSLAEALAAQSGLVVTGLRWWVVQFPLARPLVHASAAADHLESVVVELTVPEGVGWAEVRGNGGYATGEGTAEVCAALAGVRSGPVGATTERLVQHCRLAAMAIDVAAWDAYGRLNALPLHQCLGALPTDRWPTHGQVFFGTPEESSAVAASLVAGGFTRLKVRVGSPDPALDVARLAAIRAVAGADVELLVDANGGWTPEQALAAAAGFAALGVAWLEQPVAEPLALAEVARRSPVPVRADESARDAASVAALAQAGGLRGVHLKLEKAGTLTRLLAATEVAREAGLEVAFGQMDQGRLGCAATVQVAAGLGFGEAELWGCADIPPDVDTASGLELVGGSVLLPPDPGLGVAVSLERAAAGACAA